MALDNIDPTVMAEIINGVKSGMIPILMKELKSLDIPGVNEKIGKKRGREREGGEGGKKKRRAKKRRERKKKMLISLQMRGSLGRST